MNGPERGRTICKQRGRFQHADDAPLPISKLCENALLLARWDMRGAELHMLTSCLHDLLAPCVGGNLFGDRHVEEPCRRASGCVALEKRKALDSACLKVKRRCRERVKEKGKKELFAAGGVAPSASRCGCPYTYWYRNYLCYIIITLLTLFLQGQTCRVIRSTLLVTRFSLP